MDPHGRHRRGLGVELAPSDRLWHIARLAWRTDPLRLPARGPRAPWPRRVQAHRPERRAWDFGEDDAPTTIAGAGHDLCRVASRRIPVSATDLTWEGPDGEAVLALIRTWA